MAISHFSLFLLFSIFFLFNFPSTQASININTPLIQKTCKKIAAENPNIPLNFCLKSLQLATQHSCHTDLRHLGLVSIGLVRSNVTSTRHQITRLMRNKSLDPFVKACLSDCLELYSDAVSTTKQAMGDYRMKRYTDANVAISSVMDAATTCEDGFKEKEGVNSPLKKRDEDAFKLGAISLAIMDNFIE